MQRRVTRPVGRGGDLRDGPRDDRLGHRRVLGEVLNDHFDGDVRLVHFPAIVISDQRQSRVGDLCFTRAFGFAEIRHADDIVTQLVIRERFGTRAERRAFHVDVGAAVVNAGFQGAAIL